MACVRKRRMIIEEQDARPSATDLEVIATFATSQLNNPAEGKVLYVQGIKNNGNWRSMCYASQNFRAYYTLQLYNARVNLTKKALEKAVEESYVPRRFFKNVKSVASLGCGAGSDLCGFKTFLAESFPFSSRGKQAPHFTGYDMELGWMNYLLNLGFDFESLEIDESFLNNMNGVDVILMSYCTKELCREFPRDAFGECALWKAISQKAKFVLIIDNENSFANDFPSEKEDFEHFTLNDILGNKAVVYCKFTADE